MNIHNLEAAAIRGTAVTCWTDIACYRVLVVKVVFVGVTPQTISVVVHCYQYCFCYRVQGEQGSRSRQRRLLHQAILWNDSRMTDLLVSSGASGQLKDWQV